MERNHLEHAKKKAPSGAWNGRTIAGAPLFLSRRPKLCQQHEVPLQSSKGVSISSLILRMIFFSNRDTWTCEIPNRSATSDCVWSL